VFLQNCKAAIGQVLRGYYSLADVFRQQAGATNELPIYLCLCGRKLKKVKCSKHKPLFF
jgi:hypothetical protein